MSQITFETATHLGTALATLLARRYLTDPGARYDAASGLATGKVPDEMDRRELGRQLEGIADRIVRRLRSFITTATRVPSDVDAEAVARELRAVLEVPFGIELLAGREAEPAGLTRHLQQESSSRAVKLSAAQARLHGIALERSVRFLFQATTVLPRFDALQVPEVLTRLAHSGLDVELVLRAVETVEDRVESPTGDWRVEADYRIALIEEVDRVDLFGADIPPEAQRNLLTEAFVQLNVTGREDGGEEEHRLLSFESLLDRMSGDGGRLLIRGAAGSGKTTLLRWAALQAAGLERTREGSGWTLRRFDEVTKGELVPEPSWRTRVPILVFLRHVAEERMPRPEDFPALVAGGPGRPPETWIRSILASGQALVLLDGVDEVPRAVRDELAEGLRSLLGAFPGNSWVVTTRPDAVTVDWLDDMAFQKARVSPLSVQDRARFVRQWHKAVEGELTRRGRQADLSPEAEALIENLAENPALGPLATNPLLCAMICALHRERHRKLPEDEKDLVEALCHMLLHRRERESGLDASRFPESYRELNYRQKRALVQEIACNMVETGVSAVHTDVATAWIAEALARFPGRSAQEAGVVLETLIERSGMLRETGLDQVDFLHNTFKEYLAGERLADESRIEVLEEMALAEGSHRVALFAVACSNLSFASAFVRRLLYAPAKGPDEERARKVLALQCQAVALALDPDLLSRLEGLVAELFPPRSLEDAEALARLGDAAVPHLARREGMAEEEAVASVRALRLIHTGAARKRLREYRDARSWPVAVELAQAVNPLEIPLVRERVLEGNQVPPEIVRQVTDLSPLAGLEGVTTLDLTNTWVSDLAPLAGLSSLQRLDLDGTQVSDLAPLAGLSGLERLNLARTQVSDLAPLAGLSSLQRLDLTGTQVSDLAPLAGLSSLESLDLSGTQVSDLAPLAGLSSLQGLDLKETQVSDLAPLAGLSSLQGLDLTATEVCDLGPLARLSSLRRLDIEASEVSDLAPLAKLSSLQKLRFAGTPVSDLAPLAGLSSLRRLDLSGTEASDLAPLAGLSSLQRLDLEGTQVSDLAPLTGLSSLELVDLRGTQVSDLGPVENIPHIKIVVENIPGLHLVPPSPRELLRDPGGPVPDRVSPEATATKIYELDMGNFRGFERERFWFPTRFTVLIGDNGTGKTAILEALAAGLGAFCSVFDPGCRRDIRDDDVRRVVRREGDTTTIEPQYPAWVRCEGLLAGEPLVWTFGLGMAAMAGEQEPEGERWAARLAGKLQQRVRDGEPVVLPVLAYYPSGRLWHQKSGEPTATLSPGSRTRGYTGCLDPESSLSDLLAWFKTREMQAIQEKKRPGDLEAVRRAVAAAMKDLDKGVVEVVYDVGADELVAVFADGRRLPFRMLSEGVRTMLAMVADIAWRAATLNPHLGSRAPVETPGIVLIDEIDLHLHPVWQRRVVADLRRAFPLIQFVATTHSPFIVQSLDAEQLVNLERREAPREASPGDRTLEQIAEDEMGVAYPERSWKKVREMHEAAAEYYRLLEKEPDSPDLPRLKRRLDERLAPFSDDPAFQLLVEMERRREGDRDDS